MKMLRELRGKELRVGTLKNVPDPELSVPVERSQGAHQTEAEHRGTAPTMPPRSSSRSQQPSQKRREADAASPQKRSSFQAAVDRALLSSSSSDNGSSGDPESSDSDVQLVHKRPKANKAKLGTPPTGNADPAAGKRKGWSYAEKLGAIRLGEHDVFLSRVRLLSRLHVHGTCTLEHQDPQSHSSSGRRSERMPCPGPGCV